jgi:hypothetical protein
MARPHPPKHADLALTALQTLVNGCISTRRPATQDVASALTLGLLLGQADHDVADWLLWAEEGENDRAAVELRQDLDTQEVNAKITDRLTKQYRLIMAHDQYWRTVRDASR